MISNPLPVESQPSTYTGRGVLPQSRGLVDSLVEGWDFRIPYTYRLYMSLCRGCRYLFENCSKGTEKREGSRGKKAYRGNNRTSIYTLYQCSVPAGVEAQGEKGPVWLD